MPMNGGFVLSRPSSYMRFLVGSRSSPATPLHRPPGTVTTKKDEDNISPTIPLRDSADIGIEKLLGGFSSDGFNES